MQSRPPMEIKSSRAGSPPPTPPTGSWIHQQTLATARGRDQTGSEREKEPRG